MKMTEELYALTIMKRNSDCSYSWYCHALFNDFETAQQDARKLHESGKIIDWKINRPVIVLKKEDS